MPEQEMSRHVRDAVAMLRMASGRVPADVLLRRITAFHKTLAAYPPCNAPDFDTFYALVTDGAPQPNRAVRRAATRRRP